MFAVTFLAIFCAALFFPVLTATLEQVPISPPEEPGERTIYQYICDEQRYSRMRKAIETSDKIVSILNSSSSHVTFFALPNWALQPPEGDKDKELVPSQDSQEFGLGWAINALEHAPSDTGCDRKKLLRKFIQAILSYHILPNALDSTKLTQNITHLTKLLFHGAYGDQPLRVRVEHVLLPPVTTINFYSKLVRANVDFSNGILHDLNHPLLPPPSVFQELFLLASKFSILTSALQRTDLTEFVDLRPVQDGEKIEFEGTPAITMFAPSNTAFDALPKKLRFYLFSPPGLRALRKILQYHVVPKIILHTDYIHNTTRGEHEDDVEGCLDEKHYQLPTLLKGRTLDVMVIKRNITVPLPGPRQPSLVTRKMVVNGETVLVSDAVALNGAAHAIHKVLDPRCPRHHRGRENGNDVVNTSNCNNWETWEEWLPKWANMD